MKCTKNIPVIGEPQTLGIKRGTTLGLRGARRSSDGKIILTKADRGYFVIKKNWDDANALVRKTIDDMTFDSEGYYHILIKPRDTELLPYGKYVWDLTFDEDSADYRAKPAGGYFIVGNSSGWIVNEKGGE